MFHKASMAGRYIYMSGTRYWVVKTEPEVYPWERLVAEGGVEWDGVRNYQARNHLRSMKNGDLVIVYHSNSNPPGAIGVAIVDREAGADPTQFDPNSPYYDPGSNLEDPRWSSVHIAPVRGLELVPLETLRNLPQLHGSALTAKGNRLSVSELTYSGFQAIVETGSK